MSEFVPEITHMRLASGQCCVPAEWTDEQVLEFVNGERPTGLDHGWHVRKEGHPGLQGDPERVPCSKRPGFVHVTFEC